MSTPTPIKRVALAGAGGNVGTHVLNALLAASFSVTVLTRHTGPAPSLPASVAVVPVDYESPEQLTAALRGHDAVVSTLTTAAAASQLALIDAAAAAGVRRFVPSEFGSDTTHPGPAALPVFGAKVAVRRLLEEKSAAAPAFTYTLVVNGPLLDWGLRTNFLLDLTDRKVRMFDGGRHEFDATALPDVGRAVAGVLAHPGETANRAVYVRSARLTLRRLADVVQEVTGKDGWKEEDVDVKELVAGAMEELKKGNPNPMPWIFPMLQASIFGGEAYGMPFEKLDNDLLGVKEMTEEGLKGLVKEIVEGGRK